LIGVYHNGIDRYGMTTLIGPGGWGAFVETVMNTNVRNNPGNFWTS
jgi:hypothetical protein